MQKYAICINVSSSIILATMLQKEFQLMSTLFSWPNVFYAIKDHCSLAASKLKLSSREQKIEISHLIFFSCYIYI